MPVVFFAKKTEFGRLRGETMKGSVKKLCDIESIVIPEEMLEVRVDGDLIEEEVGNLALRYANETEVGTVAKGDIVYCEADKGSFPDGRTIILYTGAALPGAEAAEEAAAGRSVGDGFETVLADKAAALKIVKIIRRTPAEINDELVASIGIYGVSSVDGYREYMREKNLADLRMEKGKELSRYIVERMEEGSSFEYSEKDFDDYCEKSLAQMPAEPGFEMQIGPEELRSSLLSQLKLGWMSEALCEKKGIKIDDAAIEAEADQMAEMMGLMGENAPDRAELIEASRQNALITEFFMEIDKIIDNKLGGANGNG